MAPDELAWNVLTSAEQAYVKSQYFTLFANWHQAHESKPIRFMLKNQNVVVTLTLPTSNIQRFIHTPLAEVRAWMEECMDLTTINVKVKHFKLWQMTWLRRAGHLHLFNGQLKCTSKIASSSATSSLKYTPEGRTLVVTNI